MSFGVAKGIKIDKTIYFVTKHKNISLGEARGIVKKYNSQNSDLKTEFYIEYESIIKGKKQYKEDDLIHHV